MADSCAPQPIRRSARSYCRATPPAARHRHQSQARWQPFAHSHRAGGWRRRGLIGHGHHIGCVGLSLRETPHMRLRHAQYRRRRVRDRDNLPDVAAFLGKPKRAIGTRGDPHGTGGGVGTGYSVMVPKTVMRPMLLPLDSANHSAPSGPSAIPIGAAPAVGTAYSAIAPLVLMRPILLPAVSVNHRAPSGPAAIPNGEEAGVGYRDTP